LKENGIDGLIYQFIQMKGIAPLQGEIIAKE
jgi:hypothetical protein